MYLLTARLFSIYNSTYNSQFRMKSNARYKPQIDKPHTLMTVFAGAIILVDETIVRTNSKPEVWRDTVESRGFRLDFP